MDYYPSQLPQDYLQSSPLPPLFTTAYHYHHLHQHLPPPLQYSSSDSPSCTIAMEVPNASLTEFQASVQAAFAKMNASLQATTTAIDASLAKFRTVVMGASATELTSKYLVSEDSLPMVADFGGKDPPTLPNIVHEQSLIYSESVEVGFEYNEKDDEVVAELVDKEEIDDNEGNGHMFNRVGIGVESIGVYDAYDIALKMFDEMPEPETEVFNENSTQLHKVLEDAHKVFDGNPKRDKATWTSENQYGCTAKALEFFEEMGLRGTKPNGVPRGLESTEVVTAKEKASSCLTITATNVGDDSFMSSEEIVVKEVQKAVFVIVVDVLESYREEYYVMMGGVPIGDNIVGDSNVSEMPISSSNNAIAESLPEEEIKHASKRSFSRKSMITALIMVLAVALISVLAINSPLTDGVVLKDSSYMNEYNPSEMTEVTESVRVSLNGLVHRVQVWSASSVSFINEFILNIRGAKTAFPLQFYNLSLMEDVQGNAYSFFDQSDKEMKKIGELVTTEKAKSRSSRRKSGNLILAPDPPLDETEDAAHQCSDNQSKKRGRPAKNVTKRKCATIHIAREAMSCNRELKMSKKMKVSFEGSLNDEVVIQIREAYHTVDENGNQPTVKSTLFAHRSSMQKLPTLNSNVALRRCDAILAKTECEFCQSSEESEASREIVHYCNGTASQVHTQPSHHQASFKLIVIKFIVTFVCSKVLAAAATTQLLKLLSSSNVIVGVYCVDALVPVGSRMICWKEETWLMKIMVMTMCRLLKCRGRSIRFLLGMRIKHGKDDLYVANLDQVGLLHL